MKFSYNDNITMHRLNTADFHRIFVRFCSYAAHCTFGLLIGVIPVQLTKYSTGRLRPHFLDVCKPNVNLTVLCGSGSASSHDYIEDYVCLGGPEARVRNARLSFYSGHASTAMNVAVFCVMYLQARLPRRIYGISLLPLFQTMLIGGALLVGYSRVSDNMHHPTDVMVGFAAGLMVALVSVSSFLGIIIETFVIC
ncbi:unnamed protein product [Anisakis simplex]|uniref:AcidPPc domain-containing protein n=1 Tax=Anisakis simplex TaxID=6269 RepID=A0A0M3J8J4_ANISI|nr:unnamed protein product [Anisakis simplex]